MSKCRVCGNYFGVTFIGSRKDPNDLCPFHASYQVEQEDEQNDEEKGEKSDSQG